MKILVDADACPTKEIIVFYAKKYNLKCLMFLDTSHVYSDDYSKIYMVDKGPDSVDFFLLNFINKGDLVISNDYGVASMALSKGALSIDNCGKEYTNSNIDFLLSSKHLSMNLRKQGTRMKGPKKRSKENNISFEKALIRVIEKSKN